IKEYGQMFAILEIAGKQFRIEKDSVIKIPFMKKEVGDKVEFDRILLMNDGKDVKVGKPLVDGAKVTATVVEHNRDKKILVFKKKRRKGYKVKRGHRQQYTKIKVENIA
ncbi:MAG: 50S ribosomal protein L21, partial [Calditrichia bacterium]